MTDKIDVVASVCAELAAGALDEAASRLRRDYPFAPEPITRRQYGPIASTRVFIRDGFVDRYTGERLIFPPVFRILSFVLPAEFPFHPNWRADATHPAYWELGATVDHVVPVARGGADDESNWVTTSMARHGAKMSFTLEELGWTMQPPGDFTRWDGLLHWFLEYTDAQPASLAYASVRQWHKAARRALARSDISAAR